jgi:F0F1-type ATP synthase assembly protein I
MEDPSQLPEDKEAKTRLQWLRMSSLAIEFVCMVLVLGYVGMKLDESRGWSPWGSLGGFLLGTAAGLVLMVRQANKMN